MKPLSFAFAFVSFSSLIVITSCSLDEDRTPIELLEKRLKETDLNANMEKRYFMNHPLPVGEDHLRVLCIGNSYTMDALRYVFPILDAAGIRGDSYSIYSAISPGASLAYWWEAASTSVNVMITHTCGHHMPVEEGSLRELLAQEWDVITFQQYSGDAIDYGTFNPWLRSLISLVLECCPNPNVSLAWQTAWSYSESFNSQMSSYERWAYISLATQQMVMNDGIDVLIPTGTAIQNARTTILNTENQLTLDGSHLDLGVGCYTASCTWVQAIFAPVFGFTVLGNSSMPAMGNDSAEPDKFQSVIEEYQTLSQRCAMEAIHSPFWVNF